MWALLCKILHEAGQPKNPRLLEDSLYVFTGTHDSSRSMSNDECQTSFLKLRRKKSSYQDKKYQERAILKKSDYKHTFLSLRLHETEYPRYKKSGNSTEKNVNIICH